jgi:DNA replication and repair protein RecF
MVIQSLKLKNYRNYEYLDLQFDPQINILYGDNAQGKTNILEALYVSGTTKSHRGTKDKDLIQFQHDQAHIETVVRRDSRTTQIDVHLKKNHAKGIAIDRIPIRKASELFGQIHFVFFSPEDLNMIKDGPSARRKFIDFELSQMDKVYFYHLMQYQRILNQRNTLLKDISLRPELVDTLDLWDAQLVTYARKVIERRKQFMEEVNPILARIHENLTGGRESLYLTYEAHTQEDALEEAIFRARQKDCKYKTTSVGPHRDDLCFMVGDLDIRKFGSQGQQRTAALSLKLAEIELVRSVIRENPILLLDDVLSELDKHRQNYLLDSIKDVQTLITCTGLDEFVQHRFAINKIFHIEKGNAVRVN